LGKSRAHKAGKAFSARGKSLKGKKKQRSGGKREDSILEDLKVPGPALEEKKSVHVLRGGRRGNLQEKKRGLLKVGTSLTDEFKEFAGKRRRERE